jgi:hypothetical protein
MAKKLMAGALIAASYLTILTGAAAQQATPAVPETSVVVKGIKEASPWFRVESRHFIVYSDTSNDDVALLLNNLEKLDYMLRIYTQPYRKADRPEQKITFYYQERTGGLAAVGTDMPANAIGLYSSCVASVQGFGVHIERLTLPSNAQLPKTPQNESMAYLFEAYTRHFLYRYTDIRSPTSFIEGLAQYFASVRFSDTQMLLGKAPTNIRDYLHFLDDGHRYSLNYKDVLEQNDTDANNYASTPGVRLEYAARSWLLTHYMLSTEDNRKRMHVYLTAIDRNVAPTQAFEAAFGIKVADLGLILWRYQRKISVLQVDVPTLPAARMHFTSLPVSAGEFVLADAALKSCPSPKAGVALLRQLASSAATFPSSDIAQMALSRAQIDWGNPQDAKPYLTRATAKDDATAEAFYLLGLADLRLAQRGDAAGRQAALQAARASLTRASGMDPESAETAFALFELSLSNAAQPDAAGLNAAITAWQNAHEINALARHAALSYAYQGDMEKAASTLKLMAHNIRDKASQEWAKDWQAKLAAGAGQPELLGEMRKQATTPVAAQEWTIANALVMRDVQFKAGLDAARGYLNQQGQNPQNPDQALSSRPDQR